MRTEPLRSKKEIERIIEGLKKEGKEREVILFMLGIYTNLKIRDILRLKVRNIKNEFIQIKSRNTGVYKRIFIPNELRKIIGLYIIEKREDEYLFNSKHKKDNPITLTQVYRILKKIQYDFKIKSNVGTETLRKTYGYILYKKYGLNEVVKELGYENQLSAMEYIGVTEEELNKATLSLDFLEN